MTGMLHRVLLGGLGATFEEKSAGSTKFTISFPADLIITTESYDNRNGEIVRYSATRPRGRRSRVGLRGEEVGAELTISIWLWEWDGLLAPKPLGHQTPLDVGAHTTFGMRRHWRASSGARTVEQLLKDLKQKKFPTFVMHHGASRSYVQAYLRETRRSLREFRVWLDMLEERGVIRHD